MSKQNSPDGEGEIERLEKQLRELKARQADGTGEPVEPAPKAVPASSRKPGKPEAIKSRQRAITSVLAPGYSTSTQAGSMYNSILRAMALMGKLETHDHFFALFKKSPTAQSARKLMDQIGVYETELKQTVYADMLFKEHQDKRTRQLKNRAAQGDGKARSILADPAIGDGKGRWRGDMKEACDILYGGRSLESWGKLKNTNILRRAKVMLDRAYRETQTVLFLYPRKHHALFQRARQLAEE